MNLHLAVGRNRNDLMTEITSRPISIDPITSHTLPLHKKVLGDTPFVILENLTNLSSTGTGLFTLCALPLKLHNGDGAPIRAVALLP